MPKIGHSVSLCLFQDSGGGRLFGCLDDLTSGEICILFPSATYQCVNQSPILDKETFFFRSRSFGRWLSLPFFSPEIALGHGSPGASASSPSW